MKLSNKILLGFLGVIFLFALTGMMFIRKSLTTYKSEHPRKSIAEDVNKTYPPFHTVQIESRARYKIVQGDQWKVVIPGAYIDMIGSSFKDGTLSFTSNARQDSLRKAEGYSMYSYEIEITVPQIDTLRASAGNEIQMELKQDNLALFLDGQVVARLVNMNLASLLLRSQGEARFGTNESFIGQADVVLRDSASARIEPFKNGTLKARLLDKSLLTVSGAIDSLDMKISPEARFEKKR